MGSCYYSFHRFSDFFRCCIHNLCRGSREIHCAKGCKSKDVKRKFKLLFFGRWAVIIIVLFIIFLIFSVVVIHNLCSSSREIHCSKCCNHHHLEKTRKRDTDAQKSFQFLSSIYLYNECCIIYYNLITNHPHRMQYTIAIPKQTNNQSCS